MKSLYEPKNPGFVASFYWFLINHRTNTNSMASMDIIPAEHQQFVGSLNFVYTEFKRICDSCQNDEDLQRVEFYYSQINVCKIHCTKQKNKAKAPRSSRRSTSSTTSTTSTTDIVDLTTPHYQDISTAAAVPCAAVVPYAEAVPFAAESQSRSVTLPTMEDDEIEINFDTLRISSYTEEGAEHLPPPVTSSSSRGLFRP